MGKIQVETTKESFGSVVHLLQQSVCGVDLEVGIFTCDDGKSLENHDHGKLSEWCYILKGEAIFEIGAEKTLVKAGEMILLPANIKHLSYPAEKGEDFTSIYIITREKEVELADAN